MFGRIALQTEMSQVISPIEKIYKFNWIRWTKQEDPSYKYYTPNPDLTETEPEDIIENYKTPE